MAMRTLPCLIDCYILCYLHVSDAVSNASVLSWFKTRLASKTDFYSNDCTFFIIDCYNMLYITRCLWAVALVSKIVPRGVGKNENASHLVFQVLVTESHN
jgi:hypothetical protein